MFPGLGLVFRVQCFSLITTHRPQSSSFLGLPYRILNMNPKKELLWSLWVVFRVQCFSLIANGLHFPASEFGGL